MADSPRCRSWDWEEAGLSPDELVVGSSDDSDVVELETADPAAIARKRSFQKTAIPKSENVSKRTRVAHGQSTEVAISAETRVREFPDEPLKSDCGKLVCLACHTTLSGKKSISMSHIATARHKQGKSRLERETQRKKLVKESFLAYHLCAASIKLYVFVPSVHVYLILYSPYSHCTDVRSSVLGP